MSEGVPVDGVRNKGKCLDAVLAPDVLRDRVGLWRGEHAEVEFIKKSENTTYSFSGDEQKYVPRLTANAHRRELQVESELEWIRFLDGQGISVVKPVLSESGKMGGIHLQGRLRV